MTISKTCHELSNAMMVRQRLIERALGALREDDLHGAVMDILNCLDHIQDNERRLLELHAECHGMIQFCYKAVESEALRRPVMFSVDPGQAATDGDPDAG